MKKFMTLITCAAFVLSPALQGADANSPRQVGKAAEDGKNAAGKRTWVAFAVAAVVVGVAAATLAIIAKDKKVHGSGSSSSSSSH